MSTPLLETLPEHAEGIVATMSAFSNVWLTPSNHFASLEQKQSAASGEVAQSHRGNKRAIIVHVLVPSVGVAEHFWRQWRMEQLYLAREDFFMPASLDFSRLWRSACGRG